MFSGFRLGRPLGVEVRVDWSVAIVMGLVVFNLGLIHFPAWHPGWGVPLCLVTALAAAVLLFASILAHELSHALVAMAEGLPVDGITLFVFGGAARVRGEPRDPGAELVMAAVGPLVSIALGLGATLVGSVLAMGRLGLPAAPMALVRSAGPVAALLLWLGPVNLLIGVFNLLPGFPLDGGRVLRAILWAATGSLRRATFWAAAAGRLLGWTLIALGVLATFGASLPLLGTGPFAGLSLAVVGWFLQGAALQSRRRHEVVDSLAGLRVADVMRTEVDRVSPDLPVRALFDRAVRGGDPRAFPVVEGDRFVGVVWLEDVRAGE